MRTISSTAYWFSSNTQGDYREMAIGRFKPKTWTALHRPWYLGGELISDYEERLKKEGVSISDEYRKNYI